MPKEKAVLVEWAPPVSVYKNSLGHVFILDGQDGERYYLAYPEPTLPRQVSKHQIVVLEHIKKNTWRLANVG